MSYTVKRTCESRRLVGSRNKIMPIDWQPWHAQCVASSFGVPIERVLRVVIGDTDNVPYGGGTWASRAAYGRRRSGVGRPGKALRCNVLAVAGQDLRGGAFDPRYPRRRGGGRKRRPPAHRPRRDRAHRLFPARYLAARLPGRTYRSTRHYVPKAWPFAFTNGIQASHVEVDIETGRVTLAEALVRGGLRHHHQPAAGRRAGARRRGAGASVREMRGRRARAAL